jgi:hypothetical protein
MNVTIIVPDGFVSKDGVGYSNLDLSGIDPTVHAVQFSGSSGWVEYAVTSSGEKPQNTPITSLSGFDPALTAWAEADAAAHQPPPAPTPEQIRAQIVIDTQVHLDTFAQTRAYDNMLSLCTYATSTIEKYRVEGQYGVDSRDATWETLYQIFDEADAGKRPEPTSFADVVGDLPPLVWPN